MKLLQITPISNAVIAGRTAWQSFHKGGNYKESTNNISIDDFNFLERLFKKFKHLSVAEHIYITVEVNCYLEELLTLQEHFIKVYKILNKKAIAEVTFNLRTYFEWKNEKEYKWFFDKFNKLKLPYVYDCLIHNKEYIFNEEYSYESFQNKSLNNYIDILYIHKNELDKNTLITFKLKNISRALLQEMVRHDEELKPTIKSTRYTLKELKDEQFINNNIINYSSVIKYIVLTDDYEINKELAYSLERLRQLLNTNKPIDKVKYNLPECYKTEGIFTTNLTNLKNLVKLRTDKSALWEFQLVANELKDQLNIIKG